MASGMGNTLQSLRERMIGGVAVVDKDAREVELSLHQMEVLDREMRRRRIGEMQSFMRSRPMRAAIIPDKPSTDMLKAMAAPELVEGDSRQALAIEAEDLLGYTPLRKDAGAPSKLQRLLAELEIAPFDIATVSEYKDKMREHFQAIADAKNPQPRQSLDSRVWMARFVTEVRWSMVELESYGKPVPEFVIRKCLEIKKRAPEAKFFVDELREESRTLDPFMVVKLGNTEEFAYIEVWDEPEFEKAL